MKTIAEFHWTERGLVLLMEENQRPDCDQFYYHLKVRDREGSVGGGSLSRCKDLAMAQFHAAVNLCLSAIICPPFFVVSLPKLVLDMEAADGKPLETSENDGRNRPGLLD